MVKKLVSPMIIILLLPFTAGLARSYDADLNALLLESSELMQSGQVPQALILMKAREADYSKSREFMNNLAVAYLGNSQPELAFSILRQLVDNDPMYSIITHNLLEMELQVNDAREDTIKPILFVQTVESFFDEELAGIQSANNAPSPALITARVAPIQSQTSRIDSSDSRSAASSEQKIIAAAVVDIWATAWSTKNYNNYISSYSEQFTGPNGENYSDWSRLRKQRLERPGAISIRTSNLQIASNGPYQLRVTFDQRYSSPNYSDRVLKELILAREDADWKILRESTLATY